MTIGGLQYKTVIYLDDMIARVQAAKGRESRASGINP